MRKIEHTLETFFIFYDSFVLPQVSGATLLSLKTECMSYLQVAENLKTYRK